MKRSTIADSSAGALAVALLVFGGLVVLKPAIDHWDDVYRGDPFASGTTTERVERQKVGERTVTRTTTTEASASFGERALAKSGLLFLRLSLVAVTALLAAAALRRALLGSQARREEHTGSPLAPDAEQPVEPARPIAEGTAARAPVSNGSDTVELPAGAGLASSLAKLVATRREALGISQRELAKRAGISHTVISRIENGQHAPSAKTVERLADALR